MGKGDLRTKKGKRYRGTFGKSRPRRNKNKSTKRGATGAGFRSGRTPG